jgi:hypothetical protein
VTEEEWEALWEGSLMPIEWGAGGCTVLMGTEEASVKNEESANLQETSVGQWNLESKPRARVASIRVLERWN